MLAMTADQIDSRHGDDLADGALGILLGLGADRYVLAPDRTAGDEVQALARDGRAVLDAALALLRTGDWRVGIGIGRVRRPLPDVTRAIGGSAFVNARRGVDEARRHPFGCVVIADDPQQTATLQPLVDLLLYFRGRRTRPGWEIWDLLESGFNQKDAAARLGITPQAASRRALSAGVRLDAAARGALASLLDAADPDPAPVATAAAGASGED
jgi:hypothetical protein